MKKLVWILLALLSLTTVARAADKNNTVINLPSQKTQESLDFKLNPHKHCPEGAKMVAEIDGTKFSVPRWYTIFRMENGDQLGDFNVERPDFSCEQNFLPSVRQIVTARFNVGKINDPLDKYLTTYREVKKEIDAAKSEKKIVTLPSGIQKINHWNKIWEIYILPNEKAPTKNGEPVVMICDVKRPAPSHIFDHCRVKYVHPSGLHLEYVFLLTDYEDYNFIDADKAQREKFDTMIEEGKTLPTYKAGDKK